MKKNQSYTAEFKAEAVKLVLEQKLSHQSGYLRLQRMPVRGLSKVRAVAYLYALAHNLMRMVRHGRHGKGF